MQKSSLPKSLSKIMSKKITRSTPGVRIKVSVKVKEHQRGQKSLKISKLVCLSKPEKSDWK
jgi:hypothetical protein